MSLSSSCSRQQYVFDYMNGLDLIQNKKNYTHPTPPILVVDHRWPHKVTSAQVQSEAPGSNRWRPDLEAVAKSNWRSPNLAIPLPDLARDVQVRPPAVRSSCIVSRSSNTIWSRLPNLVVTARFDRRTIGSDSGLTRSSRLDLVAADKEGGGDFFFFYERSLFSM